MSRKNKAPKKTFYPDSQYDSVIVSKFINFIMYDGKRTAAEKIIYKVFEQIKKKTEECKSWWKQYKSKLQENIFNKINS